MQGSYISRRSFIGIAGMSRGPSPVSVWQVARVPTAAPAESRQRRLR